MSSLDASLADIILGGGSGGGGGGGRGGEREGLGGELLCVVCCCVVFFVICDVVLDSYHVPYHLANIKLPGAPAKITWQTFM